MRGGWVSTSLGLSWDNSASMKRIELVAENLISPRAVSIVLIFCLAIGVLFFGYFFQRSRAILSSDNYRSKLKSLDSGGVPSFLRLPISLPYELSERPKLISREMFGVELGHEMTPEKGFLSALNASFRGPGLVNGKLYLLEFGSSADALDFYLTKGFAEKNWGPSGTGFSTKVIFLTLSGNYLQISKGWQDSPSQGLPVHQQLALNLHAPIFSLPALNDAKSFVRQNFIWEAISIEGVVRLVFPGLNQAFLINSQEFQIKRTPDTVERVYRMGSFQAIRSFSRRSNRVLYHQNFGGFDLIMPGYNKALSRQQRLNLRRVLRKAH
jgi:hypothetical protein